MESASGEPACAKEALDLLNCVADPSFDRDSCLRFLHALRDCVLQKKVKKFSLAEPGQSANTPSAQEKS